MRVGTNPLKYRPVPATPKVVAAVITHLPNQEGYHTDRLEIIKSSLRSMREGAPGKYILVWDNGSCLALREWLETFLTPTDRLVFSPNVGKSSALKAIFGMFPPETTIAYGDDDIEYYPGWLDAQLELLDRFPPAVVSGWPVRPVFAKNNERTIAWARAAWLRGEAELDEGKLIPDECMEDYALSVGVHLEDLPAGGLDMLITYKGSKAYANSQHCQFVARVKDIAPLLQFDNFGSADESKLDARIDEAGLLRLTTVERYTRHLGNVRERSTTITIGPPWPHTPIQSLGAEVI